MKPKRTRRPNPGDRISSLPEPIIHHILSLLPHKDVKVTSCLSKSWYQISNYSPYFDFDDSLLKHYFEPSGYTPVKRSYPCFYFDYPPFEHYFKLYKHNVDMYLNYVTKTLDRFCKLSDVQIQRLTVPIKFSPVVVPLLDSWISLVLQHGIQELNLDIRYKLGGGDHRPCYNLPRPFFATKSIKEAKLGGCSLLQSFPCGSSSNLLKLHLDHVLLDDLILSSIISTCPLIEDLALLSCMGIKRIQMSNLRKLKTLRISHNWFKKETIEMVEIDAPSLQSLDILGSVEIQVLQCHKLTHLSLDNVKFEDFTLQEFLSSLSFLRSLSLENISSLTKLKMSSDTLNKLRVKCDGLVELKIDAPNLLSLDYNSNCPFSMYKLAMIAEINAPSLQSLDIHGSIEIRVLECSKLTHLSLDDVEFEDFPLQDFLSRLSSLRSLSLENISSLTKLKMLSVTLNKLSVIGCYRLVELKIDAPNLLSLDYNVKYPLSIHKEAIKTVEIKASSLQSLDIHGPIKIRVLECPKLTHLNLDDVELDDFRLEDFLLRLFFLRSLSLANISSLTKLKMSSVTLNRLTVLECEDLVELNIDAPNLLSLDYNHAYTLCPLSMHKVTCRWSGYNPKRVNPISIEDFLVVLRNFVSKAKHLENLDLYLQNIQPLRFKELNKRAVRPVATIDHLQLYLIDCVPKKYSYHDLLDCMLWSCHPRTLSLHSDRNFRNDNKIEKLILEVMRSPSIFPCKPARSWLHCLEDVRYVTEDGKEDRVFMDGTFVHYLCGSYSEIKFMFKW